MGCDAVLTHHPPIFPTLAAVTDGSAASELVLRAAEGRVAVIAAHTNLDAATGGLNDLMAEILGIGDVRPLRPGPAVPACGLGRVGIGGLHHPRGHRRARAVGVRRGAGELRGRPVDAGASASRAAPARAARSSTTPARPRPTPT